MSGVLTLGFIVHLVLNDPLSFDNGWTERVACFQHFHEHAIDSIVLVNEQASSPNNSI